MPEQGGALFVQGRFRFAAGPYAHRTGIDDFFDADPPGTGHHVAGPCHIDIVHGPGVRDPETVVGSDVIDLVTPVHSLSNGFRIPDVPLNRLHIQGGQLRRCVYIPDQCTDVMSCRLQSFCHVVADKPGGPCYKGSQKISPELDIFD